MMKNSLMGLCAVLLLSSACTTTRRFSVPRPAAARGDAVVLTDTKGNEHVVQHGKLKTVDGKIHEIPAYLMSPAQERAAIQALVYEDSRCGVRGGAIAAGVGVGVGFLLGAATYKNSCSGLGSNDYCIDLGRSFSAVAGGAVGLLLSPVTALIGSSVAKRRCAQVQPASVH